MTNMEKGDEADGKERWWEKRELGGGDEENKRRRADFDRGQFTRQVSTTTRLFCLLLFLFTRRAD